MRKQAVVGQSSNNTLLGTQPCSWSTQKLYTPPPTSPTQKKVYGVCMFLLSHTRKRYEHITAASKWSTCHNMVPYTRREIPQRRHNNIKSISLHSDLLLDLLPAELKQIYKWATTFWYVTWKSTNFSEKWRSSVILLQILFGLLIVVISSLAVKISCKFCDKKLGEKNSLWLPI